MSFVAALTGSYNDNNSVVNKIVTGSGWPSSKCTTLEILKGERDLFIWISFLLLRSNENPLHALVGQGRGVQNNIKYTKLTNSRWCGGF